jgi:hypothetical protein
MDRIEFAIERRELGVGPDECAEPIINGQRLTDLFTSVEPPRLSSYAGMRPDELLPRLKDVGPAGDVQILRCGCGDDLCSWARVEVETSEDVVVWRRFRASRAEPAAYAALGPYRFTRREYELALAKATR